MSVCILSRLFLLGQQKLIFLSYSYEEIKWNDNSVDCLSLGLEIILSVSSIHIRSVLTMLILSTQVFQQNTHCKMFKKMNERVVMFSVELYCRLVQHDMES
jgi:hypothetical protein